MVGSTKVAKYFSRVLERGRLDEVNFKDSAYVLSSREQVEQGQLTDSDTEKLFALHDEAVNRYKKKGTDQGEPSAENKDAGEEPTEGEAGSVSKDRTLHVVISAATILSSRNSSEGPAGLLLLSAVLHSDGRLEPDLETSPFTWIPSERLSTPKVEDREIMAGELVDFWRHANTHLDADATHIEATDDALNAADDMFTAVTGNSTEDFAAVVAQTDNGFTVDLDHCYIQEYDRINAVGGLLDIYDFLGSQKSMPSLVDRMIHGWKYRRTAEATIHDGDGLYTAARESCGSMSDGFPLTDSQRRAVHAFLTDGSDGEVTAVSGPPGTGKTTMLQSVVANLLTRRALDKAAPPVIVGMSTNNQAVTNIISSFASVTKDDPGSLDFRWLPESRAGEAVEARMSSLAVYCPSRSKLDEAKKRYLVEQSGKDETYTDYSTDAYIEEATNRFLTNAHAYFRVLEPVEPMRERIYEELADVDLCRLDLIEAMCKHGATSSQYQGLCAEVSENLRWQSFAGIDQLANCNDLESLDKVLDTTLRYLQFWLAVHYFESQWLTAAFIPEEDRFKSTASVMNLYWQQAAALTPCFVMTAYQVPKYFKKYSKKGEPSRFDLGRIDLLIVDEAGQVDTPIGLPAFAVAKRALVVGDEQQLAPVWSLDDVTDQQMADGSGIAKEEWTEELKSRGMTCSDSSSLMRAASHASRWSFGDESPGLFLSEHFRCHPGIITYCNELLYDGLLHPMRKAENSRLEGTTPAFIFSEVSGSADHRQGSSRTNRAEATAIATWIVENYQYFFHEYNEKVAAANDKVNEAEIIGVVTPFSAQARLITQELAIAIDDADPTTDMPANLLKLITVGTAHKLQGAERPIILFSAVYGKDSGQAGFIDKNPQLMNVAVSRAKDLFIVFAARRRWDNGTVFKLMAKHVHKAPIDFAHRKREEADPDDHEETTETHEAEPGAQEVMVIPPKPEQPPQDTLASNASSDPETTSASAAKPASVPIPTREPATEAMGSDRKSLTVTGLLNDWKAAGNLRTEDSDLKAGVFNKRLNAAGILEGAPGAWIPSTLAGLLGVDVEVIEPTGRESYESIKYSPQFQVILLELYRDSKV